MRQLVWFRNDLRTADHPALIQAMACGETIACYCICVDQWRTHDMGDRRLAFIQRTLTDLAGGLAKLNVPLKILITPHFEEIPEALVELATALAAKQVHITDEYPIDERRRDQHCATALAHAGIALQRYTADTVFAPGTVMTGAGKPYTVFSPFYKQWRGRLGTISTAQSAVPPSQAPSAVASDPIPTAWGGVPAELEETLWPAGEAAAQRQLFRFLEDRIDDYGAARDIPSVQGTSGLSTHLAVGAIAPAACVRAALALQALDPHGGDSAEKWIAEIAWRDFYRHIVALFDHVNFGHAFKREYDRLRWRQAPDELAAWQRGETGYPLVDAGMRQLLATGWMHNRVRMVTAMFLTKHLLIDWREGEKYFMQQLVDGDFPSNNGGWQWSASVGTDAAPYFRIFNPATQGERFDAAGHYVRHWVPELSSVPDKQLFKTPATGSQPRLPTLPGMEQATYRHPMVDHKAARQRALDFFKAD